MIDGIRPNGIAGAIGDSSDRTGMDYLGRSDLAKRIARTSRVGQVDRPREQTLNALGARSAPGHNLVAAAE